MKNKFQIIIPMSGFGERFRKAGYVLPKPLIEIDGKPIIAHVIDLFPGESDFFFICNQDHLDEPSYRMRETIQHYCPTGKIVGISAHKLGPIHAVKQIESFIDLDRPVIVNYCDFTCYWDWSHFKYFVDKSGCAGVLPAYRGFHPHSLGSTNYAYIKEVDGCVKDIQEKKPFTENRMNEFASSGTYYFSSGRIMSKAFDEVIKKNLHVGEEFYVSLAYKILINEGMSVAVYPLQHFMQWGTPEDVAEYRRWSALFRDVLTSTKLQNDNPRGSLVIPMAGLGKRFSEEGYRLTKPLIPVSGSPMVIQAVNDFPNTLHQVFILRKDMPGNFDITKSLSANFPNSIFSFLPEITQGQACTTLIGLKALENFSRSDVEPVTVGACDNGMLFDSDVLEQMMNDAEIDVIVWGVRGHTNSVRHPQMFGWIEAEGEKIKSISVKKPLQSPSSDPIVIGAFTFRRLNDLHTAIENLIARDGKVNGEFYLDSCINDALDLGLKCRLFEIDHYISWGTPNDLKTFEYWQSCFHKWSGHPYQVQKDRRVSAEGMEGLIGNFYIEPPEIVRCD